MDQLPPPPTPEPPTPPPPSSRPPQDPPGVQAPPPLRGLVGLWARWQERKPPGWADGLFGVVSFTVGALFAVYQAFVYYVSLWGDDVAGPQRDAAARHELAWEHGIIVAALIIGALALLCHARWAALMQLALAVLAFVLTISAAAAYGHDHPNPPVPTRSPTSTVSYSPCYSGSDTCD